MDLASTEESFLAVMLLELLFLAAGLAVVKGRKHSVREVVFAPRQDPAPPAIYLNRITIGVGIGGALFLAGVLVATLTQSIVTLIAGDAFYADSQGGAVNVTPPSFSLGGLILAIAGQFFLVGFCEEFFFRGVLFHDLFPRRQKLGALVSSGGFAIYHVFPGIVPWSTLLVNFPYYFIIGLLLALLAWKRHFNLTANVVAHGTFNTVIFLMLFVP